VSDELPDVERLVLSAYEGAGPLQLHCRRRGAEVMFDTCAVCDHCVGFSLRDSFLICGWEGPAETGAPIAPDAQALHPSGVRQHDADEPESR
jgi:hypothetical protein